METGTGIGVCLRHALKFNFKNLYSIDVDEDLIHQAKSKFSDANIHLLNGYSTEVLEGLIPTLPSDEPIMFFLDAHFPGADFKKISYEESIKTYKEQAFPLIEEIRIIKKYRDVSKDIFIIDDWKLYDTSLNYEMPGWEYRNLQVELGLDTPAEEIISELRDTHNIDIILRHQGFLFAKPKV